MEPGHSKEQNKQLRDTLQELLQSKKQNRVLELMRFGRQHGFLDSSLRSAAYMRLLDITEVDLETNQIGLAVDLGLEPDEVIVNDAHRSFLGYKELANLSQEDLKNKRKDLSQILHYFFKRHKSFSYYQGLNSFGELFLMTFGKSLGYLVLEKYSLKYLRKYLTNEDFESEVKNQISITLHILTKEVPEYKKIFDIGDNGQGAQEKLGFIVSWIVTWFSYKMKNIEQIFRIFDYLMCTPSHTISILVSLVIREVIRDHNISVRSDDELVFSSFYSVQLDGIDWQRMFMQCDILYATEYHDGVSPPANSSILKRLGTIKFKGFVLPRLGETKKSKEGESAEKESPQKPSFFSKVNTFGKNLINKLL